MGLSWGQGRGVLPHCGDQGQAQAAGPILGANDAWSGRGTPQASGPGRKPLQLRQPGSVLGGGPGPKPFGAIIRNGITTPPLRCFSSFHRTVPQRMWNHFWKVSTQGLFVAMFWPLIPQFVCNCLFYWALYFNPIINIDLVVKEVRRLETQVL